MAKPSLQECICEALLARGCLYVKDYANNCKLFSDKDTRFYVGRNGSFRAGTFRAGANRATSLTVNATFKRECIEQGKLILASKKSLAKRKNFVL